MKFLVVALTLLLSIGCKHDHKPVSAELKQAYEIQQSALSTNKKIDALDVALPSSLNLKRAEWLKNMVEIPGMDHDHSNCNHDHNRQTISISDTEMIAVQQAWRDSINVIWEKVEALK